MSEAADFDSCLFQTWFPSPTDALLSLSLLTCSCGAEGVGGERVADAGGEPRGGGGEAVLHAGVRPQAVGAEDGAAHEAEGETRGRGESTTPPAPLHPADTDTEQASNNHCVIKKLKLYLLQHCFKYSKPIGCVV